MIYIKTHSQDSSSSHGNLITSQEQLHREKYTQKKLPHPPLLLKPGEKHTLSLYFT